MTPEEDERISAEYGVTPGEWTRYDAAVLADGATISHCPNGPHNRHQEPNAALMAASKPMLALLEIAEERLRYMSDTVSRDICSDIRALLDGLKGGSNEED